jgi:hypothetical protein
MLIKDFKRWNEKGIRGQREDGNHGGSLQHLLYRRWVGKPSLNQEYEREEPSDRSLTLQLKRIEYGDISIEDKV